jgi:Domain of unknown function (DUF4345)
MLKWKNAQLLFGAIIVAIVALEYGIAPGKTVKLLLGINTTNSNLNQVFRASMGLYLGMASLWKICGVRQPCLRQFFLVAWPSEE